MIKIIFCILLLPLLISCGNNVKAVKNDNIKREGVYNSNHLEEGEWRYFDNIKNSIVEEGIFDNGLRVGLWKYYTPTLDSIKWQKYSNVNGSIKTNIPDFLTVVEDSITSSSFKLHDTSKIFNLVIGNGYNNNVTDLGLYKKILDSNLREHDVIIKDSSYIYVKTNTGKRYLNTYLLGYMPGAKTIDKSFSFFNIAGINSKGNLIDVSIRCEYKYENIGRKVFYSIFPNLFVDSERFLSTEEVIETFDPG